MEQGKHKSRGEGNEAESSGMTSRKLSRGQSADSPLAWNSYIRENKSARDTWRCLETDRRILELEKRVDDVEGWAETYGKVAELQAGMLENLANSMGDRKMPANHVENIEELRRQTTCRIPSARESIQRPSSAHRGLADDFTRIQDHLLHDMADTCCYSRQSKCTDTWMELATVLQTRNRYLERELEEYKDMYSSLVQDVRWQMGTQVELEETLEAEQEEKASIMEDLRNMQMRWTRLVELVSSRPSSPIGAQASQEDTALEDNAQSPTSRRRSDHSSRRTSTKNHSEECPFLSDSPCQPKPRGDHITATAFEFFPKHSMAIFPGNSPRLLQFPRDTTLPQILEILQNRRKPSLEDDPYVVRMRQIMDIREEMGVQLPETLNDEKIVIAIPDTPHEVREDGNVKFAAWETTFPESDTEGLTTQLRGVELETDGTNDYDKMPQIPPDTENEDGRHDLCDRVDTMTSADDNYSDTESLILCNCGICTNHDFNPYINMQGSSAPPLVSVRGGAGNDKSYDMRRNVRQESTVKDPNTSSLPVNEVEEEITSDWYGVRKLNPFPAAEVSDLPRPNISPKSPENAIFPRLNDQQELSLVQDSYKQRAPSTLDRANRVESKPTSRVEDESTDSDWHRSFSEGHGKQTAYPKSQSPCRMPCCVSYSKWLLHSNRSVSRRSGSEESIRHEYDASTPTTTTSRPSFKWMDEACQQNRKWDIASSTEYPFPTVKDPEPHLRGGAADSEDTDDDDEDWQPEWYNFASQTHCSGCQCGAFRSSSWLPSKAVLRSSLPADRRFSTQHRIQQNGGVESDARQAEYGPEGNNLSILNSIPQGASGASIHHLHHPRVSSLNHLTQSKTHGSSEYEVIRWLENPRPAPPIPTIHQQPSGRNRKLELGRLDRMYSKATRMTKSRPTRWPNLETPTLSSSNRPSSYRPRQYEVSKVGQHDTGSSRIPSTQTSLRKQVAALVRILRLTGSKSMQTHTSIHSKTNSTSSPQASTDQEDRKVEARQVKPSVSATFIDKPLPPMPKVPSRATSIESMYSRPPSSLLLTTPQTVPRLLSQYTVLRKPQVEARTADSLHEAFATEGVGQWVPPTVAGPSNPRRETRMRSEWKKPLEKGELDFDGMASNLA